ncbi:MAG: hypothetical protein KAU17_13295, partial [Spirochaetales bacterium]|nr:hypothetical protein [Spirochaetales bacterium]
KPGWVRISLHPTMTDKELDYILEAIEEVIANRNEWAEDYYYTEESGQFIHKSCPAPVEEDFRSWFKL